MSCCASLPSSASIRRVRACSTSKAIRTGCTALMMPRGRRDREISSRATILVGLLPVDATLMLANVLGALFCKPSPNLELIVSHITSKHVGCRQEVRRLVDKVDDDDHLPVSGGYQKRD